MIFAILLLGISSYLWFDFLSKYFGFEEDNNESDN